MTYYTDVCQCLLCVFVFTGVDIQEIEREIKQEPLSLERALCNEKVFRSYYETIFYLTSYITGFFPKLLQLLQKVK